MLNESNANLVPDVIGRGSMG